MVIIKCRKVEKCEMRNKNIFWIYNKSINMVRLTTHGSAKMCSPLVQPRFSSNFLLILTYSYFLLILSNFFTVVQPRFSSNRMDWHSVECQSILCYVLYWNPVIGDFISVWSFQPLCVWHLFSVCKFCCVHVIVILMYGEFCKIK